MADHNKIKEELEKELQELGKEYDALKTLYEKEITGRKQTEDNLQASEQKFKNNSHLVIDENGKAVKIEGTLADFTERKRAEEVLQDIIEKNPMSIQIVDKEGFTLKVNPAHTLLFGSVPPSDFSIFADLQRKHPEFEQLILLAKSGEVVHLPDIYYNANDVSSEFPDVPVWIRAIIFPLFDNHGKPERFVFMHENITERKHSEDALRESEEKYRSLIQYSSDPIFSFNPDGTYKFVNEAFVKVFGLKPNDLTGKSPHFIFPYDEAEKRLTVVRQVLQTGQKGEIEVKVVSQSGKVFYYLTMLDPIKNDQGQVLFVTCISKDITERKIAEQELIKAKSHAEESDRLKSAFLANMSHEIRTPMNGILGFAGLLKEPNLTGEEQQEYIRIIEKSGTRMLNIINDIISISKIESGLMEVDIVKSNLNDQIEYIYSLFKPEVEGKGMQFSYKKSLPGNEANIKTDWEKMYAILTNLIKNAIKYTNKGSIEFGYDIVDTHHAVNLQFFVKDTGIGIAKDRQEAIFERFIQADITDKQAYQGAGLGLSIAKAYVEMLGGKIWLESEPGKGSIFYFTIHYTAETEAKIVTEDVSLGIGADNHGKNLKILIAEDDETSKMFITRVVKKISHQVLQAKTGVEAVEACRNNPDFELILMDIRMPDMNGYEATRQIRQFNKDVIIIAQTAFGLTGDREKAIAAGCNDYISKPIDKNLLMRLIQKHFKS